MSTWTLASPQKSPLLTASDTDGDRAPVTPETFSSSHASARSPLPLSHHKNDRQQGPKSQSRQPLHRHEQHHDHCDDEQLKPLHISPQLHPPSSSSPSHAIGELAQRFQLQARYLRTIILHTAISDLRVLTQLAQAKVDSKDALISSFIRETEVGTFAA
jgi:hypothetical protein